MVEMGWEEAAASGLGVAVTGWVAGAMAAPGAAVMAVQRAAAVRGLHHGGRGAVAL